MAALLALDRPFVVGVVTDRSVAAAELSVASASRDGADAVELNLPAIGTLSADELGVLAGLGPVVYTSCRRAAFMAVYGLDPSMCPRRSEQQRMEDQIALLGLGSRAIDMELDTFDPSPAPVLGSQGAVAMAGAHGEPFEMSRDNSAVAKQQEVVARTKALGGEVIASCHTGRRQTADQLVAIVETAAARGADLVKVVTSSLDAGDVDQIYEAHARLRSGVPFALIGTGPAGDVTRRPGPRSSSSWYLGRPSVSSYPFAGQPPVSELDRDRRPLTS